MDCNSFSGCPDPRVGDRWSWWSWLALPRGALGIALSLLSWLGISRWTGRLQLSESTRTQSTASWSAALSLYYTRTWTLPLWLQCLAEDWNTLYRCLEPLLTQLRAGRFIPVQAGISPLSCYLVHFVYSMSLLAYFFFFLCVPRNHEKEDRWICIW